MKPCHICERIIRIQKTYRCDKCNKAYCLPCINQHFQSTFKTQNKIQNIVIPNLKLSPCFACKKECKCLKCIAKSCFFYNKSLSSDGSSSLPAMKQELVSMDEPIPEIGLFKNTQINELSIFMQRIYLKKKSIYNKHKLFEAPLYDMNKDNQNQNNELGQSKQKADQQYLQGKDAYESLKNQQLKQKIDEQMDNDNQEMGQQQVIEEERQISNASQNINDEINLQQLDADMNDNSDQQQSHKQNEIKERSKIIEQALQNRKDDSSIQIQVVQ